MNDPLLKIWELGEETIIYHGIQNLTTAQLLKGTSNDYALKFIFSKKATKNDEIFTVDLTFTK